MQKVGDHPPQQSTPLSFQEENASETTSGSFNLVNPASHRPFCRRLYQHLRQGSPTGTRQTSLMAQTRHSGATKRRPRAGEVRTRSGCWKCRGWFLVQQLCSVYVLAIALTQTAAERRVKCPGKRRLSGRSGNSTDPWGQSSDPSVDIASGSASPARTTYV